VNAGYQVLTLVLIQRVAAVFTTSVEARALAWMLQLLPIAYTYRIRANHEQAVLLCLLVALWGTERAREDARWVGLIAVGLLGTLLVKGVFAILVVAWCAVWLLTVRRRDGGPRSADRGAWLGLAGAAALALGVSAAYERAYRAVAGTSFLGYYLGKQLGNVVEPRSVCSAALHKLYNLGWYLGRVAWFPFPANLLAAVAAWRHRHVDDGRLRQGLVFALAVIAGYLIVFSLPDRKADRYIFPAYWLVGAVGLVTALRLWEPLRRGVETLDRRQPLLPQAVWIVTFSLSLAAAALQLPRPKFWLAN
jgi:4-amino-4-deoxy-L-arabinose transferase-like glycosyltransferase